MKKDPVLNNESPVPENLETDNDYDTVNALSDKNSACKRLTILLIKIPPAVRKISFYILLFSFFIWVIPALQEISTGDNSDAIVSRDLGDEQEYRRYIASIKRDIQGLTNRYNRYTSGQSYLVINTTENLFYLYRNRKLVREGHCSSGSYTLLMTEEGRSWIFKTPKGKFRIQGKVVNPVWTKPDWAFVEEGLPVPPYNHPSRYEYGVLGEYAMSLGDGYLIHGTLYKRFLGMPVTHGCVRLNDEDLEAVFKTLSIGSLVYIF
ncbi:MAG TPA: L,D-transpeptidase [Bacteroidales bacterium]|nr:L,D-transpeptidase [Bacteroidales bacterium]